MSTVYDISYMYNCKDIHYDYYLFIPPYLLAINVVISVIKFTIRLKCIITMYVINFNHFMTIKLNIHVVT